MGDGSFSDSVKNPVYSDVLLDLTPNVVFFIDSNDVVREMSKAAREYFSLGSAEEAIGKNIFSLFKNQIFSLFMKKWIQKLDAGIPIDETFPFDGNLNDTYEWFQIRAKNVVAGGRAVGRVFFISNVTELYSQKKILDTLMGSFPGDVLVFDRNLRILLVSDSIAKRNGHQSWRDVSGMTLRDLPKLDVGTIEAMLDRVILFDKPAHEVYRNSFGKGDSLWYYLDIRTIKSAAGVFGYILTEFDITGEIKPKAVLEAIMDSSSDAIAIVNPDGIIEYASKVLVQTLGIQEWKSVVSHPWSHLFQSMHAGIGGFTELFSGNFSEARHGTFSVDIAEGKQYFDFRVDPLGYQDENFGMISVSTNMTELIDARDRAESAVRAKDSFLANMSHELRTPLNAILGMNELLSRTPLTMLQKNYTSHIKSSSAFLLSIIGDIIDFSRIENRKLDLDCAPFETLPMLLDVVKQVVLKTVEKDVSLTIDIDPSLPSAFVGDVIRIRQVLVNLLNNAAKFTDRGEINLTVTREGGPDGRTAMVSFAVRDTGIGIPKARQAELFERFMRIENERNRSVEGSGLGLSICKGLIALMGGTLGLESEVGKGSLFAVRIPLPVVPGAAPVASFAETENVFLLVYEPDQPTLASIRAMCAAAGIEPVICAEIGDYRVRLADPDFPWTHILFDYRAAYDVSAEAAVRRSGTRWLCLVGLGDFGDDKGCASIDLVFKPLFISDFARFLGGERVDYRLVFQVSEPLGAGPAFFRAGSVSALVVDDNTLNRKVAEGFLRMLDIRVDEAESGPAAIEMAAGRKYDLILLDHLMPGMDGLETAARLRSEGACKKTPIIALTANSGPAYADLYRRAGMDDVLHKPIDFTVFVDCVKKWVPASRRMPVIEVPRPADAWIEGLDRETGIGYTGSAENLAAILKVFVRTGPKMLRQLEDGRLGDSPAQFRQSVHSLVSSCANIGGVRLPEAARELEQAIVEGDAARIDALYPEVHGLLEKIIDGVSEYVRKQT